MEKFISLILNIIGWLQIVAGTTAIGGLLALPVYLYWRTTAGTITAVVIVSIGCLTGIVWATSIWRRHGTVAWLSQIRNIT